MWAGFAQAVVRLDLPGGEVVLTPTERLRGGAFPFADPVHIVTAYNPAGLESDEAANRERHVALGHALAGRPLVASTGSGPDGSMPEPGYAILDTTLNEAIDLGRRFGQRAIYQWAPDWLDIVGVSEAARFRLGWELRPVMEPR